MTEEELFIAVVECVNRGDFDDAFDFALRLSSDPWESNAFNLIVEMILTLELRYCYCVGVAESACEIAYSFITDQTIRTNCLCKISDAAVKYEDWETVRRASHQAIVSAFQNPNMLDLDRHHMLLPGQLTELQAEFQF